MHELRLMGVTDDGGHLVLSGDATTYLLPIDAALRSALRRDHGLDVMGRHTTGPMSPVEVQALIRGGADAQEAADRAGWSVEKVHRYEGPILAERQHVARVAGTARLRPRGIASGSPTLTERVAARLSERGVSIDDADWDSWRSDDGQWIVELYFEENGQRRRASWSFVKTSMAVAVLDDEAARLSEDDPELFEIASGRSEGRDSSPDQPVDYRGGYAPDYASTATPIQERGHAETSDLMDSLRSTSRARTRRRSGRRASAAPATVTHEDPILIEEPDGEADTPIEGVDAPVDDGPRAAVFPVDPQAQPEQARNGFPSDPQQPAAPTHEEPPLPFEDDDLTEATGDDTPRAAEEPVGDEPTEPTEPAETVEPPAEKPKPATRTRKRATRKQTARKSTPRSAKTSAASPAPAAASTPAPTSTPEPSDEPSETPSSTPRSSTSRSRKGRASVPAWDDIMFGSKPGDDA
ncbi:MAG: septation protein SepH [Mobilicoccus sp.]|nr:septation protein SepH [Mobilicoccus sp.]